MADGDTVSESVTALNTTSDATAVNVTSDASAIAVSLLVHTDAIASTSLPVLADVSDLSATVTDTSILPTVSSAGSVDDGTAAAVPPAAAAASIAAPVLTATTTAGSPHSAASSISSPEQSATDVFDDEHPADAAMTIPLVREPGSSGIALHIKPPIPVVQSSSDTSVTEVQLSDTGAAADSVGQESLVVEENGRGDRLADSETAATTSASVTASTANVSTASSSNMTSDGLAVGNDTSTEPLSDEVCSCV